MAGLRIRAATAADTVTIVALGNRFDAEDGGTQPFTAARVRRWGFGPRPLFHVLLAERAGQPVGYAMICDVFDSTQAAPAVWLQDLYVVPDARRGGVGRRLMAAVADAALARGARSIYWGVRNRNRAGLAFYRALGAVDDDARVLEFKGTAVAALAGRGR